jgi:hypothetical protein
MNISCAFHAWLSVLNTLSYKTNSLRRKHLSSHQDLPTLFQLEHHILEHEILLRMPDQPHSRTVRGTLSNPKTQEAIQNNEKPRSMLGDPGSLKAEQTNSEPLPDRQAQDGGTVDLNSSESTGQGSSGLSASDADSGSLEGSKEENKNFDPRKYLEEEKKGQPGDGNEKIEGIEWTDKKPSKL